MVTEGDFTMSFTIGSLFDGSGGFPLAAFMSGGVPVWAAEVEPYPIAVTKTRFPYMKHLGDVSKINGAEVDPVDVVSFGSPCQDLSVAGKRAGLKHEDNGDDETTRSGLILEAVRIIKEMREATHGKYPRFAVWENVPGAFSSNRGEDFRIVLEELIKIVEPTAVMPTVPKNGWAYADSYCGDGWSLAYRVFDAQYIRTAQRRRRIYLVLDLGGQCARKVLFERDSLRRYFAPSRTPWEAPTSVIEGGVGAADSEGNCVAYSFDALGSNAMKSSNPYSGCRQVEVAKTIDTTDPNPSKNQGGIAILEPFCKSKRAQTPDDVTTWKECKVANTLNAFDTGESRANELVVETIALEGNGQRPSHHGDGYIESDKSYTLNTTEVHGVAYNEVILDRAFYNQGQNAAYDPQFYEDGIVPPIVARGPSAVAYCIGNGQANQSLSEEVVGTLNCMHDQQAVVYSMKSIARNGKVLTEQTNPICACDYKDPDIVAAPPKYIVRRLTPTECSRLQGFPDGWGRPDKKDSFTEDEFQFWLNVRKTGDEINGRKQKDYTEKQILTWYNKLHTDSAEYKMWGNGIALPCAMYVMEGIADTFN